MGTIITILLSSMVGTCFGLIVCALLKANKKNTY